MNRERIERIKAAIDRIERAGEALALADLATIWGVTTPHFVNVRNQIEGFPLPISSNGSIYMYPADVALQAMLRCATQDVEDAPLERGLGADAPQSDLADGAIPLLYTEQAFNELVAANTAMQTAIGAHAEILAAKDAIIASLTDGLEESRVAGRSYLTQIKDLQGADKDSRARIDAAVEETRFQQDRAEELQRKVDRLSGYVDAVLDAKLEHKDRDGNPQSGSPVGPDLHSIPRAYRRYVTDGRIPSMAMASDDIRPQEYPAKRY